jgi:hypothetical protein
MFWEATHHLFVQDQPSFRENEGSWKITFNENSAR